MSKVAILYSLPMLMYILGIFFSAAEIQHLAGLLGVILSAMVAKTILEQNDSSGIS